MLLIDKHCDQRNLNKVEIRKLLAYNFDFFFNFWWYSQRFTWGVYKHTFSKGYNFSGSIYGSFFRIHNYEPNFSRFFN